MNLNYHKNKINAILNQNYCYEITDYLRSREFGKAVKSMIKSMFNNEIAEIKHNDVYCSPSYFLVFKNGIVCYISFNDYRYNVMGGKWYNNILYRIAKDTKDYHGESNHNCLSIEYLYNDVNTLVNRKAKILGVA